ncbi:MAG: hypothetical protein ACT4TC_12755 [Myxococcaceae bacterium]
MQQDWAARWREGRIGFHEGRPNHLLEKHLPALKGAPRLLVPLCGKAEDLKFLADQGHTVIGVELVEDAVIAFFKEHQLTPTRRERGPLKIHQSGSITLIAGDFFAVTAEDTGPLDGFYDRAALIALPPDLRPRYVKHLRTLTSGPGLVVTFDYPQEQMNGPPFSVSESEVGEHFRGRRIETLDVQPGSNPRLKILAKESCLLVHA